MKIINTIYSSHLTNDNIPAADLKLAATRCGEAEAEIIRNLYPDADLETIIRHGVSGVGAGIRVVDEDTDGEIIAVQISDALAHQSNHISDKTWA
jgi:hypothetical protein